MATFNHKIKISNGDNVDIFHPETNSTQVYDFNNEKWLSSLIGTLSSLTTTQKTSLVAAISEIADTLTTHSTTIATTSSLGHVIPDGRTITIDSNGVISSVGGGGGGGDDDDTPTPPTPPSPITNFKARNGNGSIILSWTNPVETIFSGVRIQRKTGSYPTSTSDGTTVYNGIGTIFTDTEVTVGETYYYRAFTYSSPNTFNNNTTQQVSITSISHTIYTVIIDTANSNPETSVTYADDAVGMGAGSSAWDDIYPFNEIKPVMLLNGEINYYLNPNNFEQKSSGTVADITSGTDGDVMIQIPKVYTYMRKVGDLIYVSMSSAKVDSNYKCYAHTKEGIEKDNLYIGAYAGNILSDKARSLSGVYGAFGLTSALSRSYARANGEGYQLYSFYQNLLIQILYLIKYKNLNSQATIGYGNNETGTTYRLNGTLNSQGMTAGNTSGTVKTEAVKLFGIENLWGNTYHLVDGFSTDNAFNVYTAIENFNDERTGYTNHGVAMFNFAINENRFITNVIGTTELGFLPKTAAQGSDTTYFCDGIHFHSDAIMTTRGIWEGNHCGVFGNIIVKESIGLNLLGCRISFL